MNKDLENFTTDELKKELNERNRERTDEINKETWIKEYERMKCYIIANTCLEISELEQTPERVVVNLYNRLLKINELKECITGCKDFICSLPRKLIKKLLKVKPLKIDL